MSRYLILMLLVAALWWMLRGERRAALRRREGAAQRQREAQAQAQIKGESMVACAQCDLHLPISEAVAGGVADEAGRGRLWFCSEAHRSLFERHAQHADAGAGP